MPSKRPPKPRTYTPEQRVALATEIDRRYRAGEGSIQAIAERLGTTESNYYNWRRAGLILPDESIAPPRKSEPRRLYTEAERERLRAQVDHLRAAGQSLEGACKAVGISDSSYRKWRDDIAPPRRLCAPSRSPPWFRP